ncbi:unnamed protein product [Ixodes persulcatus]
MQCQMGVTICPSHFLTLVNKEIFSYFIFKDRHSSFNLISSSILSNLISLCHFNNRRFCRIAMPSHKCVFLYTIRSVTNILLLSHSDEKLRAPLICINCLTMKTWLKTVK